VAKTALIVDDNRALAEDLAEILEAEGYRTRLFHDPQLVLREEGELRFDVALLDVRMPGMDGITLLRLLMARHPEARFVLMTGCDPEKHPRVTASGTKLIEKPFSPDTLLRALAELRRADP
jgi:DNA-binding response OmpR family regulator